MSLMNGVIWDLDGTLIDSMAHHWESWRQTMQAIGFSFTYEQFVADFGKRNDVILRGYFGPDLPEPEIAKIALQKEEVYRALVRTKGVELLPGAWHWLQKIKALNWKQALGTSAPRGNIEAIFAALKLNGFFDAATSSEDVARGKPHPDVFLAAAEKISISPEKCFVIEDAPAGIEAGKRAGMKTIGVLTTHQSLDADYVFASLEQIPENFFASHHF